MLSTCKPRSARAGAPRPPTIGERPRGADARHARVFGAALGCWLRERGADTLLLGRDARLASAELAAALQAGVRGKGIHVFDAGISIAPVRHHGARLLGTRTQVYVGCEGPHETAPGLHVMLDGARLDDESLRQIEAGAEAAEAVSMAAGSYVRADLVQSYIARLGYDVRLVQPFKLIVDGGNGVAGALAARAMRALGCHVTELFCQPDETYPHHLPDPSDPANLRELGYCLRYSDADFGVAFDGDGRRMTLVSRAADIVGPDQQMILLARSLLEREPGAHVVFDLQSSRHVARAIAAAGGRPVPAGAGPGSVLQSMLATGALLGGDAAGQICLRDRWHAGVDGIYLLARLLELLDTDPLTTLATLPRSYATPPLRAHAGNLDPMRVLASLADGAAFGGARRAADEHGVRVDFSDGFGSAWRGWRAHDLVFRFEGDTPQALDRIQAAFRRRIRRVAPRLRLPF